jgi:hypothetical protein
MRPGGSLRVYIAADAQRPSWIEVPLTGRSNTLAAFDTVLPASAGLKAVRAIYPGDPSGPGPGPCAQGTDFDNDDLVFRVQ